MGWCNKYEGDRLKTWKVMISQTWLFGKAIRFLFSHIMILTSVGYKPLTTTPIKTHGSVLFGPRSQHTTPVSY